MDKNIFKLRASYYETDRMKIVHHSNHIRYFEDARINFMHNIGCDVYELEKNGILIPNIEAYAKYKKPIKFFDEVCVEVKLVKFNGVRMKFEYVIRICETDEIAATGFTSHCFADENLVPKSIKHSFPEQYKILLENTVSE